MAAPRKYLEELKDLATRFCLRRAALARQDPTMNRGPAASSSLRFAEESIPASAIAIAHVPELCAVSKTAVTERR